MRGFQRFVAATAAAAFLAACGQGADKGAGGSDESASPLVEIAAALDACEDKGGISQAICKDVGLNKLADEIEKALDAQGKALSAEGRKAMIDGQRGLVVAEAEACGFLQDGQVKAGLKAEEVRSCLSTALTQRLSEAKAAVSDLGTFKFQEVVVASADPLVESAGMAGMGDLAPPAAKQDIRFPRIDNPGKDPNIEAFNTLVRREREFKAEDNTEEQVSYKIAFAGPELVSVRFDRYNNTIGAAHPNTAIEAVNVVMKTGKPLEAADVFKPGADWQKLLTDRAMKGIAAQLVEREVIRRPREAAAMVDQKAIGDAVQKPRLWLVNDAALVLLLPEGTFGPRAIGDYEVAVPWADLAALLNPAAPAPIGAKAAGAKAPT